MNTIHSDKKDKIPANQIVPYHGKISVKAKIDGDKKPRLYKKSQKLLSQMKSSLADDIIESRTE